MNNDLTRKITTVLYLVLFAISVILLAVAVDAGYLSWIKLPLLKAMDAGTLRDWKVGLYFLSAVFSVALVIVVGLKFGTKLPHTGALRKVMLGGFAVASIGATALSTINVGLQSVQPFLVVMLVPLLSFTIAVCLFTCARLGEGNVNANIDDFTLAGLWGGLVSVVELPFATMLLVLVFLDSGELMKAAYSTSNPPYSSAIALIIAVCIGASVWIGVIAREHERNATAIAS